MAVTDMDHNQAEAFVISQTKKREGGITDEQAKVFMRCWKLHKAKVHDSLVEGCMWNNRLTNMSWRIDLKSSSRNVQQVGTASAVVEMQLENSDAQQEKVFQT